ncbi:MAG TPA: efflux RND transporter permease subunit, partial [Pseudidiomarina sp.]|nr:efflux RND transporter permease subunit [Pseudidiomarina sp.]
MFSRFFIERPVFSSVLSIIIVLAGLAAMRGLPIAQYPQVVPPQVVVSATYPGASAEAVADAVAAPLESSINGVENMLYMTTTTYDSGEMNLKVTFAVGTDPNQAAIDVTNEMESALSRLPEEVRTGGVSVSKESNALLKIVALNSPDGSRDPIFLNNYALMTIQDEIQRVPGVGSATMFGSKTYALRIWLRPDKMAEYDLTPNDVRAAINEQNAQFAAGQFGAPPNPNNAQEFTLTVATDGRFSSVEEFEQIILKAQSDGSMVRVRDIARVELGALRYTFDAMQNQQASVPIGIYLRPGANALQTSELVDEAVERMAANFPTGVSYSVPFDTTEFVEVSISQVVQTLIEAVLLVIGVVYLFLQRFRATIIPLIAVPVSLIGAMAGMYVFGFSINLLTLLAMVLAIGIVVDDAIVVLENVERVMREEKLPPKQAAIKAMEEVAGPVIAIVLVLSAVFIPVAFIGGLAGIMYQQFAITIAISVIISGIVALTLTPALCALLLKEKETPPPKLLQTFNAWFERMTERYTDGVQFMLKRAALGVSLFIALIAVSAL